MSHLNRRRLMQLLAASGFTLALPAQGRTGQLLLSARDSADGRHWAVAFRLDGSEAFSVQTEQRCHDILPHPAGNAALYIARRPGTQCYWLDLNTGERLQQLNARPQRHFYGHGVFDQRGQRLFLTENDLTEPGRGVIGIYRLNGGVFEFESEISTQGVEPHQLEWLPDYSALVTANGGMRTEAGSREVLNPERIDSDLVIVRPDGKLLSKSRLPDQGPASRFVSVRHLAVRHDGSVLTAHQLFLPEELSDMALSLPLLAVKAEASSTLTPIPLSEQQAEPLNRYLASIATHPSQPWMAITAPRGNRVLVWHTAPLRCLGSLEVPDCAGITASVDGFIISSGQGRCRAVSLAGNQITTRMLALPAGGWDNHLRLTG